MNARQRRKVHAAYMDWAVLLVQDLVFHAALGSAPLDVPWLLSQNTLRRLPSRWLRPIRRWNLKYYAARVASIPGYPYFEAPTSIPFKIWARDAPWRPTWSFNAVDGSSFVRRGESIDTSFIPAAREADGA